MGDHGTDAGKSSSAAWLAVLLVLMLCSETYFLHVHSSLFFPNIRTPELSTLFTSYWPESSSSPHSDAGAPIEDWIGLEEYISGIKLSSSQEEKIRQIEDKMLIYADYAQKDYNNILRCLTPRQLELLKEPQKRVSDHRSLGIDCVGKDQQLFCLHQLYELSQKDKGSDNVINTPSPNETDEKEIPENIAPTRLMVSMSRLIEEDIEPITPAQARSILNCFTTLSQHISAIHILHTSALETLTDEQIQQAQQCELRHYEAFLSPVYLETLKEIIIKRRKGAAA